MWFTEIKEAAYETYTKKEMKMLVILYLSFITLNAVNFFFLWEKAALINSAILIPTAIIVIPIWKRVISDEKVKQKDK